MDELVQPAGIGTDGRVTVNERLIKIRSAEARAPRFQSGLSGLYSPARAKKSSERYRFGHHASLAAPLDCGSSFADDPMDRSTLVVLKSQSGEVTSSSTVSVRPLLLTNR
ncbi:hypothetical protein Baya_12968 [Bagarius yarrelli]|uniref:Uncharacterized protein n=1 Tax=Bagarius yarrelli TaxID=175774 RepID=A0A556V535_BAGYA|nr:hypothetical protein Baya_12968 [Bagarius yarrelli]